ncbi:hypothetical protein CF327_g7671 [Tilletia walkeri]|nr:hypothetical protein CF327_g7671 [Tilletia walkeri]
MPEIGMSITPSLFPYLLQDVIHFKLVCRATECSLKAPNLAYLICSNHSQTIKTLKIAVVHDEESIGTGVFQPFDEDESDEDNPWVFYKFVPPSPKPQANADLPCCPILLSRLECFHLEAGSLDYDVFRSLQMPKVTTLVLGIDADWTNDQNKLSEMPTPLSNLKHGQMGPFQKKGTALRAWEALVGRHYRTPLGNKTFTLHNKAWALL